MEREKAWEEDGRAAGFEWVRIRQGIGIGMGSKMEAKGSKDMKRRRDDDRGSGEKDGVSNEMVGYGLEVETRMKKMEQQR